MAEGLVQNKGPHMSHMHITMKQRRYTPKSWESGQIDIYAFWFKSQKFRPEWTKVNNGHAPLWFIVLWKNY